MTVIFDETETFSWSKDPEESNELIHMFCGICFPYDPDATHAFCGYEFQNEWGYGSDLPEDDDCIVCVHMDESHHQQFHS